MTSKEIKTKLDQLDQKIERRKLLIQKASEKVLQNPESLMNKYNSYTVELNRDYLNSKDADQITDVHENLNKYDENGKYDEKVWEYNCNIRKLQEHVIKLYELEINKRNTQQKYEKLLAKEEHNKEEKIQIIWDFLTDWENKAFDWYLKNAEQYFKLRKNYDESYEEWLKSDFNSNIKSWLKRGEFEKEYYYSIANLTIQITYVKSHWVYDDGHYSNNGHREYEGYEIDENKLKEVLAKEKQLKYDSLVSKVKNLIGEITNAEYLRIGAKGDINGYIEGTNGKCSLETISAGGYNIQCFHYRTLIHKIS